MTQKKTKTKTNDTRIAWEGREMCRTVEEINPIVSKASGDDVVSGEMRANVCITTDAPYMRGYYDRREHETLRCCAENVDTSRLRDMPLLINHSNDENSRIGKVLGDTLTFNGGKMRADVVFSPLRTEAVRIWKEMHLEGEKFMPQISVGYRILEATETERETDKDAIREFDVDVTRWQPYETSVVPVGADVNAGIGRSNSTELETAYNDAVEEGAKKEEGKDSKESLNMTDTPTQDNIKEQLAQAKKSAIADLRQRESGYQSTLDEYKIPAGEQKSLMKIALDADDNVAGSGELAMAKALLKRGGNDEGHSERSSDVNAPTVVLQSKRSADVYDGVPLDASDPERFEYEKAVREVSFDRLTNAIHTKGASLDGAEQACSDYLRENSSANGRNKNGGMCIPYQAFAQRNLAFKSGSAVERFRTLTTNIPSLLQTDRVAEMYREFLRDGGSILPELGVRVISRTNNGYLPVGSAGVSTSWESGDINPSQTGASSSIGAAKVDFQMRVVVAKSQISRVVERQSEPGAVSLTLEDMQRASAESLAKALLSPTNLGSGAPGALQAATGVGSVAVTANAAPTFSELVSIETTTDTNTKSFHPAGEGVYLTTPAMLGYMRATTRLASGSDRSIAEDYVGAGGIAQPMIAGKRIVRYTGLGANNIIFGYFTELFVINFSEGLEVRYDMDDDHGGQTIRSFMDCDGVVRTPQAFTKAT